MFRVCVCVCVFASVCACESVHRFIVAVFSLRIELTNSVCVSVCVHKLTHCSSSSTISSSIAVRTFTRCS